MAAQSELPQNHLKDPVKWETKETPQVSAGASLISFFVCPPRCCLICFQSCHEKKKNQLKTSSRQFHHHHAGASPAYVERDLLQADREVTIQQIHSPRLQNGKKKSILFHADKKEKENSSLETADNLCSCGLHVPAFLSQLCSPKRNEHCDTFDRSETLRPTLLCLFTSVHSLFWAS